MAMSSVRLLASVLRKPDAWLGLLGVLQGTLSHKLCTPGLNTYIFSSTKLNASNYKTLFHNIFSLRLPGLVISPENIFPFSIGLKSNISSKKNPMKSLCKKWKMKRALMKKVIVKEMSEQEEELEDEPTMVKDYKDLEKVVQSFQYDVFLSRGLDVGRNNVEDRFYKDELRLNGGKLWKQSKMVKVGDTLDLLIGEHKEAGTETVIQILLKKKKKKKKDV
uniref:Mitochondrial transcription rescue factor 1 C-terminal domain-containing protein n=1 Tax=Piliocolobus tephrosceles TaxID=591936 RepID=A0A8C9ILX9_9PRIM